jgi:omega-6 fatty acid desaturase (delta-12 desaturase)
MTRAEYLRIRDALCFQRRFVLTLAVLVTDWVLFVAGLWLATGEGTFGFLVSQFLFAVVFFHHFAILHECGHESASSSGWLNTLVGHYASVFCFMPYFPWKYIHAEHHAWSGNIDRDPTLKAVRDCQNLGPVKVGILRFVWRYWIPLVGLVQHFVFWTYPLIVFQMGRLRGSRLRRSLGSVLLLPAAYLGLYLALPAYFNLANFGLAIVVYLVLVELVNLPHHVGTELFHDPTARRKLPLWEQVRVTRSCYYPPVLSDLLLLNFNFHIEHHLFPNLPWTELRRARHLVKASLGSTYQESVGISWNLANRQKNAEEVLFRTGEVPPTGGPSPGCSNRALASPPLGSEPCGA